MITLEISPMTEGVIRVPKADDSYWKSLSPTGKPKKSSIKKKPARIVYKDYIQSDEWKKRRADFFTKYGKRCFVCTSKFRIGLHHINYGRLGKEKDEDLVALCWFHHEAFHDINGRGGNISNTTKKTSDFIVEEKDIELMRKLSKNL